MSRKTCKLPSFLSRERKSRSEHAGFQEVCSARAPDFPATVTTSTTWVAMVWQHLERIFDSRPNLKNKQRRMKTGFSVSRPILFCVVGSSSGTSERQLTRNTQDSSQVNRHRKVPQPCLTSTKSIHSLVLTLRSIVLVRVRTRSEQDALQVAPLNC